MDANGLSSNFIEADEALEYLHAALEDRHNRYSVEDAMEHLISIYGEGDEPVRYKIVTDLTDLQFSGARSFLIDVLNNDESPLLRHEAVFGIGELGKRRNDDSDRKHLIFAMLHDSHEMVRHEAAIALSAIGGEDSLPALEIATRDNSSAVASSAKYSIQSIQLNRHQTAAASAKVVNG